MCREPAAKCQHPARGLKAGQQAVEVGGREQGAGRSAGASADVEQPNPGHRSDRAGQRLPEEAPLPIGIEVLDRIVVVSRQVVRGDHEALPEMGAFADPELPDEESCEDDQAGDQKEHGWASDRDATGQAEEAAAGRPDIGD